MTRRSVAAFNLLALRAGVGLIALLGLSSAAHGFQESDEWPPVAASVAQLAEAPYLSDSEKSELRVRHGIWNDDDLKDPTLAAVAALARGAFDDPALSTPQSPLAERAEAALMRGEAGVVLELLASDSSIRARRMKAEVLIDLARLDDARKELNAIVERLKGEPPATAREGIEIVRGIMLLQKLPESADLSTRDVNAEFNGMMNVLRHVREKVDRQNHEAPLAEAEILWDKNNAAQAGKALETALSLHPRNAETWALLGRIAVAQFDFARAAKAVQRLDSLAGGSSLEGGLITVRMRLRQDDPDSAEKLLQSLRERFPRQREVLALSAACAALRYDKDAEAARVKAFETVWPGSPLARLEIGRVLSARRQYAEAIEALKQVCEKAPAWPEGFVELGLVSVQAGRDGEALAALERATGLDPFDIRASNSLALMKQIAGYARFESPHFIVRSRPGIDEVLASEMPAVLERIHARVTGNAKGGIAHEPPFKTVIELMPDHATFSVRIVGMPQIHTIAASTGPLVAMEAPRTGAGSSQGPYDWPRVLQHEYTHTVSLSRTNNRLPHWFTEAAAVYLEDSPRSYDRCQLLARSLENDELFDLDTINLGFIRPQKPTDRALAYAQGHWMYEFVIERFGIEAPLRLMDRYAAGDREAAAFQSVLGLSRDEFMSQFLAWAREQLVAWGLKPPAGTPTLRQLLAAEAKSLPVAEDGKPPALPEPTTEMVSRWLAAHPNHPEVLALSIALELDRTGGKPDPAFKPMLERYAAARPVDPMPHRLLARLALESKDPAEAIPHLEYLDAREQNSTSFAIELAKRYAAAGNPDLAYAKAERATLIAPFDPAPRELAATMALRKKDFADARRHLAALARLEPDREIHKQRLEALDKLERSR